MKLVENWKSAWKWLSMQFIAACAAIQLAVLAFPSEIKAWLPDWLTHVTAILLLVAAALGRLKDQSKPSDA